MLDTVVESCRFKEWVGWFADKLLDDQIWDVWLHKVYDGRTYDEFRDAVLDGLRPQPGPGKLQVAAIARESFDILDNFVPE